MNRPLQCMRFRQYHRSIANWLLDTLEPEHDNALNCHSWKTSHPCQASRTLNGLGYLEWSEEQFHSTLSQRALNRLPWMPRVKNPQTSLCGTPKIHRLPWMLRVKNRQDSVPNTEHIPITLNAAREESTELCAEAERYTDYLECCEWRIDRTLCAEHWRYTYYLEWNGRRFHRIFWWRALKTIALSGTR